MGAGGLNDVNYWWRLYVHLAPLLPDSPILGRVLANARAGATSPSWADPGSEVTRKDVREQLRKLREASDEELLQVSEDLEWMVKSLARTEGRSEQDMFTICYHKTFERCHPRLKEYDRMFRLYKGKKLRGKPKGPYRRYDT
jgi:hypothetical protein